MANGVAAALTIAGDQRAQLLEGVPAGSEEQAGAQADELLKKLNQLSLAIKTQQADLTGEDLSLSVVCAVSRQAGMHGAGLGGCCDVVSGCEGASGWQ